MAKFSGGGLSKLQQEAASLVELPTGPAQAPVQEAAPQPTQQQALDPSQSLRGAQQAAPTAPIDEELPAPSQPTLDPQQQLEASLSEQQRHSIPSLRERNKQPLPADPIDVATASAKPDGGIIHRANKMAMGVESGMLFPSVSLANTAGFVPAREGASGPEIAESISGEREGSLIAAVNRVGAMTNTDPRNPQMDPDFVKAASMVTENVFAQLAVGDSFEGEVTADPVAAAQGEVEATPNDGTPQPQRVAKQASNARIGQQIAQEYQRLKGAEVPSKLPRKEAETLGDAFKMMWAGQNPELVQVVRDPQNDQKYLQLTPQGEDVIAAGAADRKRLFPTTQVRPVKNPAPTGKLGGDIGENVVKQVQGSVGKGQKFGKVLEDSMRNLAQVPNVVDKQRAKILLATAIPVLQASRDPQTFNNWQAKINNVGSDKVAKYEAKHGPEVAQAEMQKAVRKLANEIQSVTQERNGANFLTYAIQGFQGRVSPQQSKFNPTTSKAVRFVTRNAVPSPAKPGSRVEKNLRQMYAMMLVKGADDLLPEGREIKLKGAEAQLEAWGDKLTALLDASMSDAEYEAVSDAVAQGLPLNDPSFPQVKGLPLDPGVDAELISMIEGKGEDGPHFIDGLIDFAKYAKAKRAGRTHHSYFNAYIDGKTNGIASNGIQMGISQTAAQTGVTRVSDTDYLDQGDVREALKNELNFQIDNTGFGGAVSEFSSELSAVARAVFNHRDLNKKTTMTFGYGKEVDSFGQDMYDTAQFLKADPTQIKDPAMREAFMASIAEVESRIPVEQEFGQTLMTLYAPALESVMSPEALAARAVMRSSAAMFAMTDGLMEIKGPTGMDLRFGRDVIHPDGATTSNYRLRGDEVAGGAQEFTSTSQEQRPTSAAAKTFDETADIGGHAYGGSVVGPVQALDAATVALTTSGKSWQRLKQSSGGNPYVHTIYDAFKADAMGFDTILEEVNANWLDASMNWSYLEETQKATKEHMMKWKAETAKRNPNEQLNDTERAYMDYIMQAEVNPNTGKKQMGNFRRRLFKAVKKDSVSLEQASKMLQKRMAQVGYNWESPPDNPTVAQLKEFVKVAEDLLQWNPRLNAAVQHTNNNKKKLAAEIKAKGYKIPSGPRKGESIALQYYAH